MDVFRDKVSLFTGAASGIGEALALALHQRGAKVIAADIDIKALLKNSTGTRQIGQTIRAVQLDVTDYEAFKQVIDDAVSREGRLDYIFNIAGIAVGGEIRDLEIEHWRAVLNVNLYGVINGSILAYKVMAKQGFGHIVNMSSIEGIMPFPATVPYVASKFAVMGLSQGLWVEGTDLGVKVSVVCPGFVKTPIFDVTPLVNLDRQEAMKSLDKLEQFSITPEKCASIILRAVAKNKPLIPVTSFVYLLWWLVRIKPSLVMDLVRRDFNKIRFKARIGKN